MTNWPTNDLTLTARGPARHHRERAWVRVQKLNPRSTGVSSRKLRAGNEGGINITPPPLKAGTSGRSEPAIEGSQRVF